jgi:hypothetical protein
MLRAGAISVITWVVGMGFRFGFAYYAYPGGAPADPPETDASRRP